MSLTPSLNPYDAFTLICVGEFDSVVSFRSDLTAIEQCPIHGHQDVAEERSQEVKYSSTRVVSIPSEKYVAWSCIPMSGRCSYVVVQDLDTNLPKFRLAPPNAFVGDDISALASLCSARSEETLLLTSSTKRNRVEFFDLDTGLHVGDICDELLAHPSNIVTVDAWADLFVGNLRNEHEQFRGTLLQYDLRTGLRLRELLQGMCVNALCPCPERECLVACVSRSLQSRASGFLHFYDHNTCQADLRINLKSQASSVYLTPDDYVLVGLWNGRCELYDLRLPIRRLESFLVSVGDLNSIVPILGTQKSQLAFGCRNGVSVWDPFTARGSFVGRRPLKGAVNDMCSFVEPLYRLGKRRMKEEVIAFLLSEQVSFVPLATAVVLQDRTLSLWRWCLDPV